MLIIKNIMIKSNCRYCKNRYEKYKLFITKYNKKHKDKSIIMKLVLLIKNKTYINFYIDYLKCLKRFYPKKYSKYIKKIKRFQYKLSKKSTIYNFYFKIIEIINSTFLKK